MARRTDIRIANMSGRNLILTRPAPPGGTQSTETVPFRRAAVFPVDQHVSFDLAFAETPDDPEAQVDFLLLNDTLTAKSVSLHVEGAGGQPLTDHHHVPTGRTLRAAYRGAVRFDIQPIADNGPS